MLRIHSFLQNIYTYMKSLSKRVYRTCAIIMIGAMIVSVIALSSQEFGGGGKNRAFAYQPQGTALDGSETEEVDADTEAKVRTENFLSAKEQKLLSFVKQQQGIEEVTEEETVEEMSGEAIEEVEEEIEGTSAENNSFIEVSSKASFNHFSAQYRISQEEYNLLLHIVAAEAGGCDMIGQILVANVVMNRIENGKFPDDVVSVVFQKNQFTPALRGTVWDSTVTDSVQEAVDRALAGEDYSNGALFFSARARLDNSSMAWFDDNLKWLFEHDGHEFYTFLE